jgi:hypothetical protein
MINHTGRVTVASILVANMIDGLAADEEAPFTLLLPFSRESTLKSNTLL